MYPWVLPPVSEARSHLKGNLFVTIEAAVSVAAYLDESINHFIKLKCLLAMLIKSMLITIFPNNPLKPKQTNRTLHD